MGQSKIAILLFAMMLLLLGTQAVILPSVKGGNQVDSDQLRNQTQRKGYTTQETKKDTKKNEESNEIKKKEETKKENIKEKEMEKYIIESKTSLLVNEKTGQATKGKVVLTIDDTGKGQLDYDMMEVLQEHQVKAIWFIDGKSLEKTKGQEIAKTLKEKGHMLGSLGYEKVNLKGLSEKGERDRIKKEIELANENFVNTIGEFPVYFRFSNGLYNDELKKTIDETGLKSIVWSVSSMDWRTKNEKEILNNVKSNLKDGGVILVHNLTHTKDLMPKIIELVRSEGYEFVLPTH